MGKHVDPLQMFEWMNEYVCGILLPLGKWQVSGLTCTKSSFSRCHGFLCASNLFYLLSTPHAQSYGSSSVSLHCIILSRDQYVCVLAILSH